MLKHFDSRELARLENYLQTINRAAFPIAVQRTLNGSAFQTQREGRQKVLADQVVRTPFTTKSIQVEKATGLSVDRMFSEAGSIADYMEKLEKGEIKIATGQQGNPLATNFASGEAEGVQPRRKVPTRRNKMGKIKFARPTSRRKPKNKKQELIFKVQDAVTTGDRYFFHDFGERRGIMKIIGGRKNFKRGWPEGARMKMVYDLTHKTLVIPPQPWLNPTFRKVAKEMPDRYGRELNAQLKRHKSVLAL